MLTPFRNRTDLQDLPLGALRQAQRILSQAEAESDSDSNTDADESGSGSDDDAPTVEDLKGKGKAKEKVQKVEWSAKRRDDIAKRSSKNAYVFSTFRDEDTNNGSVF